MLTTICDGLSCDECKSKYGKYRCGGFKDYKVKGNGK